MAIKNIVIEVALTEDFELTILECDASEWKWLNYVIGTPDMVSIDNCGNDSFAVDSSLETKLHEFKDATSHAGMDSDYVDDIIFGGFAMKVGELFENGKVHSINVVSYSIENDCAVAVVVAYE